MESEILLEFDNTNTSEANKLALDLQGYLLKTAMFESAVKKTDNDTMDFGATLVLVLGTTSALAIAKGIADWLRRKQGKRITVKTANGKIIGTNLSSDDIETIFDKISIN